MRNSFLSALRHLGEGTRLYGKDQQGQEWAVLLASVYFPLAIPLLPSGAWTDLGSWVQGIVVPGAGLLLGGHSVVVAIVIALALTPPGGPAARPIAPYPVERPVKIRIIHNCRLFIIAMMGLGTVGVVCTQGIDRLEQLAVVAIGALLLQLGHLDELNSVRTESVLELLGRHPLEDYDRWYARQWSHPRAGQRTAGRRELRRRRHAVGATIFLIHLVALLGYLLAVHGPAGLPRHGPTMLFLALAAAASTTRGFEAWLAALVAIRHTRGSRYSTWTSHPETYFAFLLLGTKALTAAAMAALPLWWVDERTVLVSVSYLAFLALDLAITGLILLTATRRWLVSYGAAIRPLAGYDRIAMGELLKKRAAKDRAAIRGAMKLRAQLAEATPKAAPAAE